MSESERESERERKRENERESESESESERERGRGRERESESERPVRRTLTTRNGRERHPRLQRGARAMGIVRALAPAAPYTPLPGPR